jgi:alkanesulfonate monooxygenase SsuD/methylene tetrahydromethanopterin reductase-like flavin-dependent oxidoreductase (luciferase family)
MLLSLWPNAQQPWDDIVTEARHADATGWHAVYLADHFMGDGGGFGEPGTPTLEATAGLAALAAVTDRVRLGPLVLGNTYRHPAVVANWAVTLDHASHGRAVLGVGAGWQVNEHEQYGIELPPRGERVTRFEEACIVLRALRKEQKHLDAGRTFEPPTFYESNFDPPVDAPFGLRRQRWIAV